MIGSNSIQRIELNCIILFEKKAPTRLAHNFLNIDPFLTRPVPIESSHSQLSIGTGLVKNGTILRKLWSNRNSITFTMCNCPVTYSYVRYITLIKLAETHRKRIYWTNSFEFDEIKYTKNNIRFIFDPAV